MASAREQYLQALASLSEMTRTRAERLTKLLAKQGELQSSQVSRAAEDLMRRVAKNRETVGRLIQREVKRQIGALGIATRDEVARLQQRVRALEQAMERAGTASSTPAPSSAGGTARAPRSSRSRQAATTATPPSRASASRAAGSRAASGTRATRSRAKPAAEQGSGSEAAGGDGQA